MSRCCRAALKLLAMLRDRGQILSLCSVMCGGTVAEHSPSPSLRAQAERCTLVIFNLVSIGLRPLLWGSHLLLKTCVNYSCQSFTHSHDQCNVCLTGRLRLLAIFSFLSLYDAEHRSLGFTLGPQSVIYVYICIALLLIFFKVCVSVWCV